MFCRSGLRAAIGAAAIAAWRPLLRKALLHAADGLFFCTRTAAAIAAWRPRLRKALLHAADGLFFCTRTAPAIRHEPRPAPSSLEPAQCRPSRPAEAGIKHLTTRSINRQRSSLPPVRSAFAYFHPPLSPFARRETLPGRADGAFCDRGHRRRTYVYVEEARPSQTFQVRGMAASQ